MISPKQTVIAGRDDPRRRSAVVSKSEGRSGFHPDKTVQVARDAHTSLNSESSSADGARDGGPRRDRGWSRERRSFDGPFGASRETRAKRAERRRKTKRNFAFCDLLQIRSSRRARRRGERERFSLSWFAGDQTLGFQREVGCRRMATRNAAKGARCSIRRRRRADAPRTFKRFRSACDSVARASFRAFSVCSGYPESFFVP